jgi:hypothetical protein
MTNQENKHEYIEPDPARAITIPVEVIESDYDNVIPFPVHRLKRGTDTGVSPQATEYIESDPVVELPNLYYEAARIAIDDAVNAIRADKDREATRQMAFLGDERDRRAEKKSDNAFNAVDSLAKPAGIPVSFAQSKKSKLEQRKVDSLNAIRDSGRGMTRTHR